MDRDFSLEDHCNCLYTMTTPTVDGEVSPSKRGTVKLRVVLVGIGWVWISLFPAM